MEGRTPDYGHPIRSPFEANDSGMQEVGLMKSAKRETVIALACKSTLGVWIDDPQQLQPELVVDFYNLSRQETISRGSEEVRSGLMFTSNNFLKGTTERENRRILYVSYSGDPITPKNPAEREKQVALKRLIDGPLSATCGEIVRIGAEFQETGFLEAIHRWEPFVLESNNGLTGDLGLHYAILHWFTRKIFEAVGRNPDRIDKFFVEKLAGTISTQQPTTSREEVRAPPQLPLLDQFRRDIVDTVTSQSEEQLKDMFQIGSFVQSQGSVDAVVIHRDFYVGKPYTSKTVHACLKSSGEGLGKSQSRQWNGVSTPTTLISQDSFHKDEMIKIKTALGNLKKPATTRVNTLPVPTTTSTINTLPGPTQTTTVNTLLVPTTTSTINTLPGPTPTTTVNTPPVPTTTSTINTLPGPTPTTTVNTPPVPTTTSTINTLPGPTPTTTVNTPPVPTTTSTINTLPGPTPTTTVNTPPVPTTTSTINTLPGPTPTTTVNTPPVPTTTSTINTLPGPTQTTTVNTPPVPTTTSTINTLPGQNTDNNCQHPSGANDDFNYQHTASTKADIDCQHTARADTNRPLNTLPVPKRTVNNLLQRFMTASDSIEIPGNQSSTNQKPEAASDCSGRSLEAVGLIPVETCNKLLEEKEARGKRRRLRGTGGQTEQTRAKKKKAAEEYVDC